MFSIKINLRFAAFMLVLPLVFFCFFPRAFANTTADLLPVADGGNDSAAWKNQAGIACSATNCYTSVADTSGASCVNSDGDTTYIVSVNAVNSNQTFDLDESNIPDNSIVTQVSVSVCARIAQTGASFQLRNCIDGACTNSGTNIVPAVSYGITTFNFSTSFIKNPSTDLEVGIVNTLANKNLRASKFSAVVTYTPPGDTTAPSAVSNLSLSGQTSSSINLSWTAPGDDGSTGTATSYDVRYSTSAITDGNWSSATQATGEPTPSVAGSSESMTVSGLSPSTTYYFAIKTSDEVPNISALSNVPSGATLAPPDTTAPVISNGAPSGALSSGTTQTTMSVTTNESATCKYSTSAGTAYASMTNTFSTTGGTSHSTTLTGLIDGTAYARYVRCIDGAGNPNTSDYTISFSVATDTTAPAAVSNLAALGPSNSSINLSWTAPGDDASTGIATSYDVRYSTSAITDGNWSSATQATGEPTPSIAGSSESMTISGLSPSTTYYFAIKISDEVPNISALSNVPSLATTAVPDTTPPVISDGAPSGVLPSGTTQTDMTVTTDESATCRYSSIAGTAYASMTNTFSITGVTSHSTTLAGLTNGTSYTRYVRCIDGAGNPDTSDYVISFSVSAFVPDTTAPVISNGAPSGSLSSGTTQTTMSATTNESATCKYSTSAGTAYASMINTFSTTGGTSHSVTLAGLTNGTSYTRYVRCIDGSSNSNTSDYTISFFVDAPAPDTTAPSAVLDLSLSGATDNSINLTWTASGDDASTGTATTYDVRYSTSAITDGNWSSATQATGEPTPSIAGSSESMTVSGLSPSTTYYFAIKTSDEIPNISALSNVPSLATTAPEPKSTIEVPTGGGGVSPTSVIFSGRAFPGSLIEVLRKSSVEETFRNIPLTTKEIKANGEFSISYTGLIGGEYLFVLRAEDRNGRKTGIVSFAQNLLSANNLVVQNIFFPPTVGFEKLTVAKNENVKIVGYSSTDSLVEFLVDGIIGGNTRPDSSSGYYSFSTSTANLALGEHYVKARQVGSDGRASDFSAPATFKVFSGLFSGADLSGDGVIDIKDWSMFLFNWGSKNLSLRMKIDMNNDKKIDVTDLSVFLKAMKSK